MSETVFELYNLDKLSIEKLQELDLHIGTELLKNDADLQKQYNKEFLIYKVNKYIENFVKENTVKAKPKRKPKAKKEEVAATPPNSEDEVEVAQEKN